MKKIENIYRYIFSIYFLNQPFTQHHINMQKGFAHSIGKLLLRTIKNILSIHKTILSIKIKSDTQIIGYVESINQFNALKPLSASMKINFYYNGNPNLVPQNTIYYPNIIAYLICLIMLPYSLFMYWVVHKKYRQYFFAKFEEFLMIPGYYVNFVLFLVITKPEILIIANDHNPIIRTLLYLSKKRGIKTVYFQHGSITDKFPKLDFNLSLLDGQDAFDKYKKAGSDMNNVKIIGMLKLVEHNQNRKRIKDINNIGFALHSEEKIEEIFRFVKEVITIYGDRCKIILRPHPAIERIKLIKDFACEYKILLSDPSIQNVFEYIRNIDLNIAQSSGIHLECIIQNVESIFINIDNMAALDSYKYIENNLVQYIANTPTDLVDIISMLNNNPNLFSQVYKRAKYYCSNLESPKSALTDALKYINELKEGKL